MNITDYIELGVLAATAIGFLLTQLNRYAVANHNDRWARVTEAGGRITDGIAEALRGLPIGADAHAVRQALIARGVRELTEEFDTSLRKLGVAPDRLATVLDRQVAARLAPSPGVLPPTAASSAP